MQTTSYRIIIISMQKQQQIKKHIQQQQSQQILSQQAPKAKGQQSPFASQQQPTSAYTQQYLAYFANIPNQWIQKSSPSYSICSRLFPEYPVKVNQQPSSVTQCSHIDTAQLLRHNITPLSCSSSSQSPSPSACTTHPTISLIGHSVSSRLATAIVCLSTFSFQITILNIQSSLTLQLQLPKIAHNSPVCQLYTCPRGVSIGDGRGGEGEGEGGEEGDQFVIKFLRFNPYLQDNVNSVVYKGIIQYCYYKLCSVLKIGPYVGQYFGADIVISDQGVQFAMEMCTNEDKQKVERLNSIEKDLKTSLKFLHQLRIVHGDIKPENIMWSNKYNKWVFIDFGFSKVVDRSKEEGGLVFTSYFGSLHYSSPEMKKAFQTKGKKLVDLYYNDVYGLKKSLQSLNRTKILKLFPNFQILYPNPIPTISQSHKKKYQNYLLNTHLKKYIFQLSFQSIQCLCQSHSLYPQSDTIELLADLPRSKKLTKILKYLISKYSLQGQGDRIKQLLLYHQFKQIDIGIDEEVRRKFEKRICVGDGQGLTLSLGDGQGQNRYSFSDVDAFIRYVFDQEIGVQFRVVKETLYDSLVANQYRKAGEIAIFWQNFTSYIGNLFTTKSQMLQIFELAKKNLNISQWKCLKNSPYQIFLKSFQIQQQYKNKFSKSLINTHLSQKLRKRYTFIFQKVPENPVLKYILQLHNTQSSPNQSHLTQLHKLTQTLSSKYPSPSSPSPPSSQVHKSKQRNFIQLLILYLEATLTQHQYRIIGGNEIELEKRYRLGEKLQAYCLAGKCRLVHDTLCMEMEQELVKKGFEQINNFVVMMQQTLYNYTLQPGFFMTTYFFHFIFLKIGKINTEEEECLGQIAFHLRQFLQYYRQLKSEYERSFMLLVNFIRYCQYYLQKQKCAKIRKIFITQIQKYYRQNPSKVTINEMHIILNMNLTEEPSIEPPQPRQPRESSSPSPSLQSLGQGSCSLSQQESPSSTPSPNFKKQLIKQILQIRSKTLPQQSNYNQHKISHIMKQIFFKNLYGEIKTQEKQEYFMKFLEEQNDFQGKNIGEYEICMVGQYVVSCMFHEGKEEKEMKMGEWAKQVEKEKKYVDLIYEYLGERFKGVVICQIQFMLMAIIVNYESLKTHNFNKIYQLIMDFMDCYKKIENSNISPIHTYVFIQNMFRCEEEESINDLILLNLEKFKEMFQKNQLFYMRYPQFISICELSLGLYFQQKTQYQIEARQLAIQIFKKARYMIEHNSCSFLVSRFKNKASFAAYKLLSNTNKKHKRLPYLSLKCLRNQQYILPQPQKHLLLSKLITKSKSKLPQCPIFAVIQKLSQHIDSIQANKIKQVQRKPIQIINLTTQIKFYQFINENYMEYLKMAKRKKMKVYFQVGDI